MNAELMKSELALKFGVGLDKSALLEMARVEKDTTTELLALRESVLSERAQLSAALALIGKEYDALVDKRSTLDRQLAEKEAAAARLSTERRKADELFKGRFSILEHLGKSCDPLTDSFLDKITSHNLTLGVIPPGEVVPLIEGTFGLAPFRLQQVGTGLYSRAFYGPYQVTIGWNVGRVGATLRVSALGPSHPHISTRDVCMGDSALSITRAFTSGEILTGLGMLVNVLTYYNPASAYSHPERQAGSPWAGLVCVECNEAGKACSCEKEVATFCAICLRKQHVSFCGACATCCGTAHNFSTAHLARNSGLNNSGCVGI